MLVYAIALGILALAGIGIVALERERRVLISDQREAIRKLYADNQALTQALCAANGQFVTLSDRQLLANQTEVKRTAQPPYFASKRGTFEP